MKKVIENIKNNKLYKSIAIIGIICFIMFIIIYLPSRAFFVKNDRSVAVVGIASTKPTFEKLLNNPVSAGFSFLG